MKLLFYLFLLSLVLTCQTPTPHPYFTDAKAILLQDSTGILTQLNIGTDWISASRKLSPLLTIDTSKVVFVLSYHWQNEEHSHIITSLVTDSLNHINAIALDIAATRAHKVIISPLQKEIIEYLDKYYSVVNDWEWQSKSIVIQMIPVQEVIDLEQHYFTIKMSRKKQGQL